jgi:hypothetical protein
VGSGQYPSRRASPKNMSASSATNMSADALQSGGAAANVIFRVRCENFRHGEEVFLVPEDDPSIKKVCEQIPAINTI